MRRMQELREMYDRDMRAREELHRREREVRVLVLWHVRYTRLHCTVFCCEQNPGSFTAAELQQQQAAHDAEQARIKAEMDRIRQQQLQRQKQQEAEQKVCVGPLRCAAVGV